MSVDPEATPDTGNSADTPDPATPENWEQRFKDTQAAYTQSQQELADLRRLANGEDPDKFKNVLDKYGYIVEDDDEDEPVPDEPAQAKPDPRIDELATWKEEQVRQQAVDLFNKHLDDLAGDRTLPQQGRDWIFQQTLANGGNPDALKKSADEWFAFMDSVVAEAAEPKKQRPRVPHVPAGGQPPADQTDTSGMSRSELNRFAVERLQAAEAQ